MSVEVPLLSRTHLDMVQVCASFSADNQRIANYVESLKSSYLDSSVGDPTPTEYVQLASRKYQSGKIHFHLNIAKLIFFGDSPPDELVPLSEITDRLSEVVGEVAECWYRCAFSLDRSSLPENGVITTFSSVTTEIDDEVLELTGARLTFSDDSRYGHLEWKQSADEVRGSLTAISPEGVLGHRYLIDAVEHLESGINRFLLERKPND